MPVDADLRRHLLNCLATDVSSGTPGRRSATNDLNRLTADARRLWSRCRTFLALHLVPEPVDAEGMELVCYALQLPMRSGEPDPRAEPGQSTPRGGSASLRDRCDRAAQRLIDELTGAMEPDLLDRTCRLLQETHQRPPMLEDAKILADAVSLDDFGVTGLLRVASELAARGESAEVLADAWQARRAYGYWNERLNNSFHFPQVRRIARRRLDHARRVIEMLAEEQNEDGLR
jgi:hypothetical protein